MYINQANEYCKKEIKKIIPNSCIKYNNNMRLLTTTGFDKQ